MRRELATLFSTRRGSSSLMMMGLLALAGLAGDRTLIYALRGVSRPNEADHALPIGYYEALINSSSWGGPATAAGPPPGWLPFGGEQTGIVQELPSYLRWNLKPNLDIRWNGTEFQTNGLGFRTPEVSIEKPSGTFRIVVFGSSNSMGYGVSNDEIYTNLLEGWMRSWIEPSHRVEVVNLSVAGDSPSRRLYRLQQEAGRFQPDWLICDASFFDSWLEDTHIQGVVDRRLPVPYPFVAEAIRRTGVTPGETQESFRTKFQGESETMLDTVYAGWGAEAKRLGVPLTVVILPRADSKGKSPRVLQLIRSLADRHGLDYLDVTTAFDALEVEEFRISAWDKHPNARGHRAIFEAIRETLRSRGQLPGFPPRREVPRMSTVSSERSGL
ncbi:MAG: SGNH/GDSL hydrolase family protein [Isosphaeraceae bacterium]